MSLPAEKLKRCPEGYRTADGRFTVTRTVIDQNDNRSESGWIVTDTKAAAEPAQLFGYFTPNTSGKFYSLAEVRAAIPAYLTTGKWDLPQWYTAELAEHAADAEMYLKRDSSGYHHFPEHYATRYAGRKRAVRSLSAKRKALDAAEKWQKQFDAIVERVTAELKPDPRPHGMRGVGSRPRRFKP